ncbi:MAG: hypothetical protein EAY75_09225 [Bacteroidetes bacterium]|nr:MAG: hypothetical protein EAY75_09225 [Bacteroidota bacterium]
MKPRIYFIALFSLLFTNVNAQVKIGGTPEAPVPSAVLELDGGTTRGLLLPRMRKMSIDAIQNPAEGLTIYATDEQALYLRRSSNWIKMNGDANAISIPYFRTFDHSVTPVFGIANTANNGVAIFGQSLGNGYGVRGFTQTGIGLNGISQNFAGTGGYFANIEGGRSLVSLDKTGIGTSSPDVLLHIDGTSSAGSTVVIDDNDDPTIQFRKAGINKSFIKQQGNDLVLRPNDQNFAGKVILQAYNQGGWMFVDANGNASLGQDPATFAGTPNNVRMHIKSTNENVLTLEALNGSGGPTLNFIEKTGNTTNSRSEISATSTAMTFSSNAQRYDWVGTGGLYGGTAMTLRRSDPGFLYWYNLGVYGNIGVGTPAPQAPIHIDDALGFSTTMIIESNISPLVSFRRGGAEKGFIQQLDNDLKIGTVGTNDPGRFIIRTNATDRLWVDSVGYVTIGGRIGPTINGPYRLAVRGKIAATDFNVVASGSWPDYVFADDYKLQSLEETEAFIKANRHLPNIPSATVVDKEGFALGDMQKRMMEKIEELTLHLIEANKNIKRQQIEIDSLKRKLD